MSKRCAIVQTTRHFAYFPQQLMLYESLAIILEAFISLGALYWLKKRCSRLSQLIIAFGNVLLIVFGAGAENRVRQRHFTSDLIFVCLGPSGRRMSLRK